MRLTIENVEKLVWMIQGEFDGRFTMDLIAGAKEKYIFRIYDKRISTYVELYLSREGRWSVEEAEWQYYFNGLSGMSHCVTADWFSDIHNAKSAIMSELKEYIKRVKI